MNVVQNIVSSSNRTMIFCLSALFGSIVISIAKTTHKRGIQSNKFYADEKVLQVPSAKISRKWSKRALLIGVLLGLCSSVCIFSCMYADVVARRIENLANMCDERARMLQDQFNVSMNHVHALAILVSSFHHGKNPSAIDQVPSHHALQGAPPISMVNKSFHFLEEKSCLWPLLTHSPVLITMIVSQPADFWEPNIIYMLQKGNKVY